MGIHTQRSQQPRASLTCDSLESQLNVLHFLQSTSYNWQRLHRSASPTDHIMSELKSGEPDNRLSKGRSQTNHSRRQFLGLLGTSATAGVRLSGTARAQQTPVVAMGTNYFDPIGLYVEQGTTVQFEIEAGSHSATAYPDRIPAKATPFDSGVISEGGFEFTFDVPGTYDYYCIPHQSMGMVGRIVVGEPGGPAEATQIPDGDVPGSEAIIEQRTVSIDEFGESSGDAHGGMMGSGSGMMNGRGLGWMMLFPIGFVITVIGVVGGIVYWAARRGKFGTKREDSAMTILREQYAQGEIDEEEFKRRREQLMNQE